MPLYSEGDIVLIADPDEEVTEGTPGILESIFANEALVRIEGRSDKSVTVPLQRLEPFYRTSMKLAH